MDLISSLISKIKNKAVELGKKVSDDEGFFQQGRFTPFKAVQEKITNWAAQPQNFQKAQEWISLGDTLNKAPSTYFQKRYKEPVFNLPEATRKLISPKSNLLERGEGALGVLSGWGTLLPDPVGDIAFPLYDTWKGYQKAKLRGKSTPEALKSAIQSATLEKPVGLGEAITTNEPLKQTLNIAELPLTFLVAGKLNKKSLTENGGALETLAKQSKTKEEFIEKVSSLASNPKYQKFAKNVGKIDLSSYFDTVKPKFAKVNVKPQVEGGVPKELEPLAEEARKYKSAEEFVKAQLTPKIEIRSKPVLYPSKEANPHVGKLAGKSTGSIDYEVFVDGKLKGKINYNPYMKDLGAYGVTSNSILGLFGHKRFKTLRGAQDFIIRSKERYLPLGSVDLMTGEKIIPKEKTPEFLIDFYNQVVKGAKEPPTPPLSPIEETVNRGEVGLGQKEALKGVSQPIEEPQIPKEQLNTQLAVGRQPLDIMGKTEVPLIPQEQGKLLQQKLKQGGSGGEQPPTEPPVGKESNSLDNFITNIKSKVNKLYTQAIDRFHPLTQLAKKAGEEKAMRNALTGHYGAGSTANYHVDFELTPILKEQNIDELRQAAIAMRDVELQSRGIQGSNTGDAIKKLEALKTKLGEEKMRSIGETLKKLYDYQDRIVKTYLVDTGVISENAYRKMRENNQFYVPFKRVMDTVDDFLGFTPQTKGAGSVSSQNVVYKIKGSKREIIDPIESILESTYKSVGLGMRQKVAQTIVSLKDSLPPGTIKEIKGTVGNKPSISLFVNGKVKHYSAPPEVVDAAKGLSEEGLNTLIKILQYPTSLFRASATGLNPEFMAPNIVRDVQSAFVNVGLNPLRWVKGLAHMIGKDEVYQDFLKYGGKSTTRISIDRPMLTKTVKEITGGKVSRGIEMLKPSNIVKALQTFGEYSETPTRLAVFEQQLKKGLQQGLSYDEAAKQAAYWAQEATVNFARRGSKTQSINAIYAFLNARAQGIDRLVRSLKNDPVGVGLRIGVISQLPAIGLYAWNRKFNSYFDDRVVSPNDKANNFIIMLSDTPIPALGGAQFIKIPKGDIGKLANPTEQFLAYADSRGGNIKESLVQVLKAFSPMDNIGDTIPTALRPPVEIAANKNFFFNQDIVPEYKKNYPAKYQDTSYTAPLYRMIGQKLNVSPAKTQALIEGYGTGLAKIGEMTTRPFIPQEYKTQKNEQGQPINRTPILRRFLGGERRTEEEQMLVDESKRKSIERQINDIKAGVNRGEIPFDDGTKKIDELRENLKTKQSGLMSEDKQYIRFMSGDSLKELDLSKITPKEGDSNYQTALKLKKAFSYVDEILDSDLSAQEQAGILSKLGITPEDAEYYNVARQPTDVKYVYVKDEIGKYGDNRQEMLNALIKMRQEINGNYILTSEIINDLVDEGVLSYDEGKYLKDLKYDKKGGVKVKLTGRGRSAKIKVPKIKVSPFRFKTKAPKVKAIEVGGIRKVKGQSGRGRILKVRKVSYK